MTRDTNVLVAIESFYVLSTGVFKASLAFFFLRVIVYPRLRQVTYAVLIVTSTYSFAYFFTVVFHCGVPSGNNFWVKTFQYQCMTDTTQKGLTYTHAVVTAGSDLYFLALVPLIVGNTKLRFKEKINIALLLAVATLGFVASLVRIKYIPIVLNHGLDFFRKSLWLAIWSAAEPGLGIISSSLATLRPLLKEISNHFRLTTQGSHTGGSTTLAGNKTGTTMENSSLETEDNSQDDIEKQKDFNTKPRRNLRTFFNTGTQLSSMRSGTNFKTFFNTGNTQLSTLRIGTNFSDENLTRASVEDPTRASVESPQLQRPSNVLRAPTIASNESTSPWTSYVNVGPQRALQDRRQQSSSPGQSDYTGRQSSTRRSTPRDGLSLGIFTVMNPDRQRSRGRF
jgi:hypothetical protein